MVRLKLQDLKTKLNLVTLEKEPVKPVEPVSAVADSTVVHHWIVSPVHVQPVIELSHQQSDSQATRERLLK